MFETKDSGQRVEFAEGMVRDSEEGKPQTWLIDRVALRQLATIVHPERLEIFDLFEKWFWEDGNLDAIYREILKIIPPWDFVCRVGQLMDRGAKKYGLFNWTKANSEESMSRFRRAAHRHFCQWYFDLADEDHLAAWAGFNAPAYEFVKRKIAPQTQGLEVTSSCG